MYVRTHTQESCTFPLDILKHNWLDRWGYSTTYGIFFFHTFLLPFRRREAIPFFHFHRKCGNATGIFLPNINSNGIGKKLTELKILGDGIFSLFQNIRIYSTVLGNVACLPHRESLKSRTQSWMYYSTLCGPERNPLPARSLPGFGGGGWPCRGKQAGRQTAFWIASRVG